MLSEAAGGEDATRELCKKLAEALNIGGAKKPEPAPAPQRRGPIVIGGLTAEEVGTSLGKLAKGVIVECTDGAEKARPGFLFRNPPAPAPRKQTLTAPSPDAPQDEVKESKRRAREEAKEREAFERHLAELATSAAGDQAYIVRDVGSGGSKDIMLENLVISNGGLPLIEDGSLLLAFGRRYGLIGAHPQAP